MSSGPPQLPPQPAWPPELQKIPINVRLPWPAILAAAETAVPRCDDLGSDNSCGSGSGPGGGGSSGVLFANEDAWQPVGVSMLGLQVGAKATLWRKDAMAIHVSGRSITGSLHMLYRARLAVGGRQVASCGYDTPREMVVTFTGTFAYAPGWYIDPSFEVDVQPVNQCTATFFNFDITGALAEAMQASLKEYAELAEDHIRAATSMRNQMTGIWDELDRPSEVSPRIWLAMNPRAIAAAPLALSDDARYLTVPLILTAVPTLTLGDRPRHASVALPALTSGAAASDFSVDVRALIGYGEASALMTRFLRTSAFSTEGVRGVRIERATLSGSGAKAVLALEIRGLFAGTLYVYGTPRFAAGVGREPGGTLVIDGMDYSLQTSSILGNLAAGIYRGRIRDALRKFAHWDVSGELQAAATQMRLMLNRNAPGKVRTALHLTRFGPGWARINPEGLEAWYRIGGTFEIFTDPF